jgi:hypothetical protein
MTAVICQQSFIKDEAVKGGAVFRTADGGLLSVGLDPRRAANPSLSSYTILSASNRALL